MGVLVAPTVDSFPLPQLVATKDPTPAPSDAPEQAGPPPTNTADLQQAITDLALLLAQAATLFSKHEPVLIDHTRTDFNATWLLAAFSHFTNVSRGFDPLTRPAHMKAAARSHPPPPDPPNTLRRSSRHNRSTMLPQPYEHG